MQKTACLVLSILVFVAGALGMVLSFFHLALSMGSMEDVASGGLGFVAGSVLVGAGLVSLTILSLREPDRSRDQSDKLRRSAHPED